MARKTLIQVRRGTAATWTGANPTLASGEIAFETDTNRFKIGDGTTAYNTLAYAGESGGAPSGAAGGDLSGTYPNPSVVNSSHDHDATTAPGDPHTALRAVDFLVGTATGELSAEIVVGSSPGGELGGTWASPTVDATHSGSTHAGAAAAETADIRAVDVLVGTATAAFSGEIVVGTSPGGELGGTWASPTVDATHSGSAHHTQSHDHSAAGDGTTLTPATLDIPSSTTPAQTAEGRAVWDSDDDKLTIGTGAGRKTLVNDDDSRLTDSRAPSGSAGGDLSGTYPNPSVVDDSHSHSASTLTGVATLGTSEPGAVSTTSSGSAGSGATASKVDHSHDLGFDDATADPSAIGTTADGTATSAARKDHVHATGAGTPSTQAFGDSATTGSGPAAAMTDHKHAMPSGTKITALSSLTPTTDDVIAIVDDPAGTPVTKKAALSTLVTLFGSANNPAALGTAAAGTSGNKMSRDDHVHPTTGLVTTSMEWTGGGGDISIADTNYVTLATITTTIAVGTVFIVDLDFLVLNNSGGTKTYTTCLDVNGFLIENVDGTTHGASATSRSRHALHGSAEVRATNLAYGEINNVWTGPTAANVSGNPSLSTLTGTWNTSTSNLTGSSVVVRVRTKASANTATQTATVLGWRIRQIG